MHCAARPTGVLRPISSFEADEHGASYLELDGLRSFRGPLPGALQRGLRGIDAGTCRESDAGCLDRGRPSRRPASGGWELQAERRLDRELQADELRLLRAGVREPRLPLGAGRRPRARLEAAQPERAGCARRLPHDRPPDRLRHARPLPRQRGGGDGPGLDDLRVGLLPRADRVRARRRPERASADREGQGDVLEHDRAPDDVPALPVRARARPRRDDLQRRQPAVGALDVQQARRPLGAAVVQRRRVHAELQPAEQALAVPLAVRQEERPPLPVRLGHGRVQALLLPPDHRAPPLRHELRLAACRRDVRKGSAPLERLLLPVVRAGRIRGLPLRPCRREPALPPHRARARRLRLRRRPRLHEQRRRRRQSGALLRPRPSGRARVLLLRDRDDPRHVRTLQGLTRPHVPRFFRRPTRTSARGS